MHIKNRYKQNTHKHPSVLITFVLSDNITDETRRKIHVKKKSYTKEGKKENCSARFSRLLLKDARIVRSRPGGH